MATTINLFFSAMDCIQANSSFWVDTALALLGLFVLSCVHQKLTSKGPMLWPVVGIIPTVFLHVHDMYQWCTQALIKSGGTFPFRGVWFGGCGVITADPTNIKYILSTRFSNFPKGEYMRERFFDLLGDGIFNADHELWKEQRRLATVEMHSARFVQQSMKTLEDLVHQKLLKVIEKVVQSGDAFDLQELLLRFTFDNICIVALGVDPGCSALGLPCVAFAKAFEEATELTMFRFLFPSFVWKPMRFLGVGFERKLQEAVKIVHDFADETVRNRRSELVKSDNSDLLSRLVEMQDSKSFSDKFLRDFCVSFILAGRDTTSVALAWFFWLLHKNPLVENKIISEISKILGKRQFQKDQNMVFTVEELKEMVYLQAALSESLRLYPSVPMEIKEVTEDDVFPDGRFLKKGSRVMYSLFSMARMETIWGMDCLEFKPERWIRDGKFVSESQYKYAVFNGGPRMCVGKNFAYMQMKMVAASMLWRYSVEVVEGQEVVPKVTTTLYMKNGMLITFKPRLQLLNNT